MAAIYEKGLYNTIYDLILFNKVYFGVSFRFRVHICVKMFLLSGRVLFLAHSVSLILCNQKCIWLISSFWLLVPVGWYDLQIVLFFLCQDIHISS